MSDLNNVYGKSNGCPAVVSDKRGVLTSNVNKSHYTQNLKNNLKAKDVYDFKEQLQQKGINYVKKFEKIPSFPCANVPDGEVKLDPEIKLNYTTENTYADAFKPLV